MDRRFGWDTHGLPVEFEIDKKLKITGPEDVMRMGIEAYNKECRSGLVSIVITTTTIITTTTTTTTTPRSIVMKYSGEWERVVGRMGRWIDFKRDYKTMYPW